MGWGKGMGWGTYDDEIGRRVAVGGGGGWGGYLVVRRAQGRVSGVLKQGGIKRAQQGVRWRVQQQGYHGGCRVVRGDLN